MANHLSFDDDNMRQRFVDGAWNSNQLIKDYPSFVEAVNSYLGMSGSGQKAIGLISDSDYKELFERQENLNRLKQNIDEKEFNEITAKTDHHIQGDSNFEVFLDKKKTREPEPKDVRIISTPKPINVTGVIRNGKPVKSYVMSRNKWGVNEKAYIHNLRNQGLKPKNVIAEYRNRFKGSSKSSSSIKNQYYKGK